MPLALRRDAPCDARPAEDVEAAERRDRTFGAHCIHANRAVPRFGGTRRRRRRRRRAGHFHWRRHVVRLGQIDDARGRVFCEVDGHHLSLSAAVCASVLHHDASARCSTRHRGRRRPNYYSKRAEEAIGLLAFVVSVAAQLLGRSIVPAPSALSPPAPARPLSYLICRHLGTRPPLVVPPPVIIYPPVSLVHQFGRGGVSFSWPAHVV